MIGCIALSIYLLIGIYFSKKEAKENKELIKEIERNRELIVENRRIRLARNNKDESDEFQDYFDRQAEKIHMKTEDWASEVKQTENRLGVQRANNFYFTFGVLFWLPIVITRSFQKN